MFLKKVCVYVCPIFAGSIVRRSLVFVCVYVCLWICFFGMLKGVCICSDVVPA